MRPNWRLALRLTSLLVVCGIYSCSGPHERTPVEVSPTHEPGSAPAPTATILPKPPAVTPSATPETFPTPDLALRPQIWFGPLDPSPPDANRPYSGRLDYFKLFSEDAPWTRAAAGIQVFKLYGGWLDRLATQPELDQIFTDLRRRGLGVAFEGGPLTATGACTGEIEGFAGPLEGGNAARKIKQAGGSLDYVDLEHPYDAVTFGGGPSACRYSPEEAARDVARYIRTIREIFPSARVGAIETADNDVEHVARWVKAYRAVMGEDLDYFSFDLNYYHPNWAEEARAIEDYLHGRGIDFGMFYRGDETDTTGAAWVAKAEQRFVEYEVIAGGRPDRVIFQSWHPQPERLLPENDPEAFTYLINRYLRTRASLDLALQPGGAASQLEGRLGDERGNPLPGARIELSIKPQSGPGLIHEYTLTGSPPDGAVQADVGYRVNTECDCSGNSEFTLYEVRYSEGEPASNLVPNGDFSAGLDGWGLWGEASAELIESDRSPGSALQVKAGPGQVAAANSGRFAVGQADNFSVTFTARVAPGAAGSGYFDLIFLDSANELQRYTVPLAAATISLGSTATDSDGRFELPLDELPTPGTFLQAWYGGNELYWPAFREILPPVD